jgi:hypothetical protein
LYLGCVASRERVEKPIQQGWASVYREGMGDKRLKAIADHVHTWLFDHFGRAFSWWLAGAGIKPGTVYGETDDFGWNITADPVHVHDMQATLLHLCGIDHRRLTFRYQGRQFRLTDVHGEVVHGICRES